MSIKDEIVKVCHLVYQNKFVSAYDGNISVRTDNNSVLITRSGICKGDVTINDILETDFDGNLINGNGKISTENKLHFFIYKNRIDVKAVVHCHPIYATALGLVEGNHLSHYFPEVLLTLGKIPVCKYATPSTEEVTDSIKDFLSDSNAFILQNHGAVTVGACLMDAYYKMEKLEHAAKTIIAAKSIGKPRELTEKNITDLLSISESTYGIKLDINKIL